MKYNIIVLSLLTALFLSGCAGNGKQAAIETAEKFITSYFAADYATAKSVSGSDLKSRVEESEAMIAELPDSLRTVFVELSSSVEIHRTEVYEYSKDSLLVEFDIIIPGEMDSMTNAVCVVRNPETGTWTVTEMR